MTSLKTVVDGYVDFAYGLVTAEPKIPTYSFVQELAAWLGKKAGENNGIKVWNPNIDTAASGSRYGLFQRSSWTLNVYGTSKKAQAKEDRAALQEFVDTVIHEAYHCEQYYVAARVLARKKIADTPQTVLKFGPIRAAVISDFAGVNNQAIGKAAQDAWDERGLTDPEKQKRDLQARQEAEQVRDWMPWFTSLPVIKWSGAVADMRKAARFLHTSARDTKTCAQFKGDDLTARSLLNQVTSSRDIIVKAAKPLQDGANMVSDATDLTSELKDQISDLNPKVMKASENAIQVVNAFIDGFDAKRGDARASSFAELGERGKPVNLLLDLAHDIYETKDPTEASAWALGREAGDKFIRKFPSSSS